MIIIVIFTVTNVIILAVAAFVPYVINNVRLRDQVRSKVAVLFAPLETDQETPLQRHRGCF